MNNKNQPKIDELLSQPVLARLATAELTTGQPHVVPVWFLWDGEALWISSFRNTQKIKILRENPRTAVIIEPDAAHPSSLQAVILQGAVEIIAEPREFITQQCLAIYTHYLGEAGVLEDEPQSWAYDPDNLILHIRPDRTIAW